MSQTHKRVFGPLTQAIIVIGALVSLYFSIEMAEPTVNRWSREWNLDRMLQSPDLNQRLYALGFLLEEDEKFARTRMLAATRDPDADVRAAACRGLVSRGLDAPTVLPVLEADAADKSDGTRAVVAELLGILAQQSGMRSRQPANGQASEAGTIGRCQAALLRLLRDPSTRVRIAAATALGETPPGSETTRALVEAALEPDQDLQLTVAATLLKLNGREDPKAVQVLGKLVTEPEPIADRARLVNLLKQLGEGPQRGIIAALVESLGRAPETVLPELIAYLSEVSSEVELAAPALARFLDHPNSAVRAAATSALANLEDKPGPRVLEGLVRMVTEAELVHEQRWFARNRLQEVAPAMLSETTSSLVRQLADPSAGVRQTALELLMSILQDRPAVLPGGP